MNVSQYEVIDTLDQTITAISKNESIDRAAAMAALKRRLTHQMRRIDTLVTVGWVSDLGAIKQLKGSEHDGL
jgi:hypothetical protein